MGVEGEHGMREGMGHVGTRLLDMYLTIYGYDGDDIRQENLGKAGGTGNFFCILWWAGHGHYVMAKGINLRRSDQQRYTFSPFGFCSFLLSLSRVCSLYCFFCIYRLVFRGFLLAGWSG